MAISIKNPQSGATLLEIMLVLVVGSFILYLSIQQYLTYRRDSDVYQLQANVNTLFQGLTAYYQMNCGGTVDATNTQVPGTLNPDYSPAPGANVPIDINNDLIANNLITSVIPLNPIVNTAGAGTTNGYVAQFNMTQPEPSRLICTAGTNATGPNDPNCTATTTVGSIVIWKAQVAVQLKNAATAKQYLNLLQGDCLSSLSGNIVTPCDTSGNTGTFVVWERLPSSANSKTVSDYWGSLPTVKQFSQMYNTYPVNDLTNGSQTTNQYFLCGN